MKFGSFALLDKGLANLDIRFLYFDATQTTQLDFEQTFRVNILLQQIVF